MSELRQSTASVLEQAFVPREIFFRSDDRFHHVRVSAGAQKVAAVVAVVLAGWMVFASSSYIVHRLVLATRDAQIQEHRLAYFDLLAEVGEYHTQFSRITRDLEENQSYLLSLLEQDPDSGRDLAKIQRQLKDSETEHARVVIARDGLRQKMEQFQSDLRDIADRNISVQSQIAKMRALVQSSQAERDQVAQARERMGRRLAEVEQELETAAVQKQALQAEIGALSGRVEALAGERTDLLGVREELSRQIAGLQTQLTEAGTRQTALKTEMSGLSTSLMEEVTRNTRMEEQRDYLQRRVGGLEQRLVDLRDAGESVMERLRAQTKLSIDVIEKTVKMTGLDVDALLADVPGENLGQGGPFVPASNSDAEFEPSVQLEESVTLLDQHLDRWSALQDVVRSIPLSAPLDQYRISSRFGERRDPVNKRKASHHGLDFAAPSNSAIYTPATGKVVYAGWRGRYGRTIEIDHGFGVRTRYAHLRKILVKKGQQVTNREKIGLVGSSGRSTGSHLHYEVRYKGRALNPMKFLQAGNHVFKG